MYSTANWFLVYFYWSIFCNQFMQDHVWIVKQRNVLICKNDIMQVDPIAGQVLRIFCLPLNSYILPNKCRTVLQNGSNTILVNGWRVWSNEKSSYFSLRFTFLEMILVEIFTRNVKVLHGYNLRRVRLVLFKFDIVRT